MSIGLIAAFWVVSILFVITPGADWAYAITAGLRDRSPLPAVLGMLAGHLIATLVVAAGVGVLVSRVPGLLTVITVAGALYLVWLGIGLLRAPAAVPQAEDGVAITSSPFAQAAKGVGISGLNPKVFLLFLALLPQFTDAAEPWPVAVQMTVLGLIHLASCAVVYLLVGYGARKVLRARPRAAFVVTRVSGVAMILIGIVLVVEKLVV
ncbi:LysE family translocator [Pseudoclavibacter sp. Z016]|uniref:LysE family translocator n=1 Tax=Pseudoclavibacter sp. Z016 TaxID=2080581 RepID=UPI000CE7F166|nr:LysE family translocator [Pseudoclavibacter sp. Z016]PPF75082.1 lysine transporter LysE [Pseudoclavibacter sp. Z016]